MRWLADMPIRRKLVLIIMLVSGIIGVLSAAISVSYEMMRSRRAMVRDLTTQAEIIGANSAAALAFQDARAAEEILRALAARPEIVYACLYTSDGKPFAEYTEAHQQEKFMPPPVPASSRYSFEGRSIVLFRTVKLGDDVVGSIGLRADLRELRTLLWVYAGIAAVIVVVLLLICLLLSTRVQRIISDPILRLAAVAQGVTTRQDYSLRATKQGQDEIGALVDDFNQMLAQVERREDALRHSEERFRQLAESIHEVFWLTDPEKNDMIYVSPAYEAIWGQPTGSLYASPRTWIDAVHPEDRSRVMQAALTKQVRGEYDEEYRIIRSDGSLRWIRDRAFPIRDQRGKIYRIAGIAEDITERKRAEQALHNTQQQLQAIMDNSPAVIYLKDRGGTFLLVNRCFEILFHITRRQLVGKTDYDLFPREAADEFRINDLKVFKAATALEFEETVPHDDGLHTYISIKFPLLDATGAPYAVCGISTDITERKRLEKEILEISDREQSRIGQDLHDGLSQHLVGTAFAVTMLEKTLTKKALPQAADAAEIGKLIDDAITQARTLARGLYPVGLETGGLSFALEHLASTSSRMFNINCRLDCPTDVNFKEGMTAMHLFRIAQEAINNAIKHSQATDVTIGLHTGNGHLTLSIEDNGVGITAAQQPRTGMGLHIMQYRARTIGAALAVGARATGGTVVRCTCPSPPPA